MATKETLRRDDAKLLAERGLDLRDIELLRAAALARGDDPVDAIARHLLIGRDSAQRLLAVAQEETAS